MECAVAGLCFGLGFVGPERLSDFWLVVVLAGSALGLAALNLLDEVLENRWPELHYVREEGGSSHGGVSLRSLIEALEEKAYWKPKAVRSCVMPDPKCTDRPKPNGKASQGPDSVVSGEELRDIIAGVEGDLHQSPHAETVHMVGLAKASSQL